MKILPDYNIQYNGIKYTQKSVKKNTAFRSATDIKTLEEKVLSNPEAKKALEDALNEIKFNEKTILDTQQKLETILGTKIGHIEISELLLSMVK